MKIEIEVEEDLEQALRELKDMTDRHPDYNYDTLEQLAHDLIFDCVEVWYDKLRKEI